MDPVVLHAFKGDWGIASIDLDCLIQLTYSKFANAPVEINFNSGPCLSRLPLATLPSGKLRTYEEFTAYLRKHNYNPNSHLPEDQRSQSLSYIHQMKNCLFPYYILTLFDNEANFNIIRKLYGKRIMFPFSLFYPGRLERFAKQFKELTYGLVLSEKDENDAHQKAVIEARIFLNTLSKKLGNQRYFFGDKPSEVDAHMYAYLAILYHIILPENPIQSHIAQCPNLVTYVKRITKEFFKEEAYDSKTSYDFSYIKGQTPEETEAANAKKERIFQIVAGMFAVGLMGAYVATSGILERGVFSRRLEHIGYDDDDEDDDEGEI